MVFEKNENFTITNASENCSLLILGGDVLSGEKYISWNFVASSKQKLQAASERWKAQEFGEVPGENEWIPLPP